ncbi:MAG: Rrf2 family transcriptional regulator [Rhodobacteraceae bacterium]|nr:Rrf2 family transcriptional regulator [Paracoccaceae bacterium]
MQLLNKESDYAIRALMQIAADKNEWLSSKQIAKKEKVPLFFVRKILQKLIKANFLFAKEGALGGVQLAKKPKELNLISILELFQGQIKISHCLFQKKPCLNKGSCVLRKRLAYIENVVIEKFETITIETLLNDLEKNGAKK